MVAQQADIVIGTRDEYDMIHRYVNETDESISQILFSYQPELVIIKHGVQGSKAYTKDGAYYVIHLSH